METVDRISYGNNDRERIDICISEEPSLFCSIYYFKLIKQLNFNFTPKS